MTFDDQTTPDGGVDHDPVVAAKFALLDRVTPPPLEIDAAGGFTAPHSKVTSLPAPAGPKFLVPALAAAAVLVLLVGVAALTIGRDDDGSTLTEAAGGDLQPAGSLAAGSARVGRLLRQITLAVRNFKTSRLRRPTSI